MYRHSDILPIDTYRSNFCRVLQEALYTKNIANTFWMAKMIIYMLSITLSTFNPIVIFTGSQFSNVFGITSFAGWKKNGTNVAKKKHFLSLNLWRYFFDTYHVSINYRYGMYRIDKSYRYAALAFAVQREKFTAGMGGRFYQTHRWRWQGLV